MTVAAPSALDALVAVAEIFAAPQGEGVLMGQPMVFIRVQGCNFECSWCDTQYAIPRHRLSELNPDSGEAWGLSIETIRDRVRDLAPRRGQRWVSITGGEPTSHKFLPELVEALRRDGFQVLIETNAAVLRDAFMPLDVFWSTSPKLSSSGMADRPVPLLRWLTQDAQGRRWQAKYVIDTEQDYAEALAQIEHYGVPAERVWMQPCSHADEDLEAYARKWRWLVELATADGWHLTVQQHRVAYGTQARGI